MRYVYRHPFFLIQPIEFKLEISKKGNLPIKRKILHIRRFPIQSIYKGNAAYFIRFLKKISL